MHINCLLEWIQKSKQCVKAVAKAYLCVYLCVCVCVDLHLFEYITLYEHSNTVMPSLIPFIQCGGNKGLISLVYFWIFSYYMDVESIEIIIIGSLYFRENNSFLCPKLIKKIATQIILENIFLIWLNMFLISSANCETEKV